MRLSLGHQMRGEDLAASGGVLYWAARPVPIGTIVASGVNTGRAQEFFDELGVLLSKLMGGKHAARTVVERIFESVRVLEYPGCISRKSCLFGNLTPHDATHWKRAKDREGTATLVLRPLPGSRLQVVSMRWFDCAMRVASGAIPQDSWLLQDTGSPEQDRGLR